MILVAVDGTVLLTGTSNHGDVFFFIVFSYKKKQLEQFSCKITMLLELETQTSVIFYQFFSFVGHQLLYVLTPFFASIQCPLP
jgi:hypothetical protein